jgi:hypothetical protein
LEIQIETVTRDPRIPKPLDWHTDDNASDFCANVPHSYHRQGSYVHLFKGICCKDSAAEAKNRNLDSGNCNIVED